MEILMDYKLWIFFFVFARLAGITLLIPYLSSSFVPNVVKIFIGLFLSYLILPSVTQVFPIDGNLFMIFYHLLVNFLFGITIGIMIQLVFYAVQFAGEFMGIQMGFALANVLDPNLNEQVSLISQLSFIFASVIFFLLKGHILMYELIISSFEKVPALFSLDGNSYIVFAQKLGDILVIGLQFAMPITAFMIFIKVALGIISRLIPQMNVFMVGLPLNILVGFLIIMVVIVTWEEEISQIFFDMYYWVKKSIILLSQ
ncbi:MAG: flagellar biosynthetic protein FliR [Thermotogota bacterium]